jgi:hypothetical protein
MFPLFADSVGTVKERKKEEGPGRKFGSFFYIKFIFNVKNS